ncbi:M23 family metallopeptidase [Catenovulum sediminis]|uniref:M23 family metallopeptidase n=1 Tax=Catenovulum sediminis TaxID=1740262 RepID=UPI00117C16E7|nr:hypothetical protein [Catenovulum sediminis]
MKAILKLSLLASICLLNNSNAQTKDVKGYTTEKAALVQGGFVRGQYQSCISVTVKDTQTEQTGQCTDDGRFLIGFGRDADTKQTLIFETTTGQKAFTVEIKKRTYKTDKITGVPQKTVTPPDSVLARIRSENEKIWVARHHKTPRLDFLSDFIWPAQGRISGVYGSQRIFNGTPKRPHYGLDIAAITGTKVIAPAAGIVRLVTVMENGETSRDWQQYWQRRWKDIYIASEEDLDSTLLQQFSEQYHIAQDNYLAFSYTASQGDFRLVGPKNCIDLIDRDTTVECLAEFMLEVMTAQSPESEFKVMAYEGVSKGAIAQNTLNTPSF